VLKTLNKKCIIGSIWVFSLATALAQTKSINLLYRINAETSVASFVRQLPSGFYGNRCVDAEYGIYSIKVGLPLAADWAIDLLNRTPGCMAAQKSHDLIRRFNPGDPLLGNQHYLETIKAIRTWDFARGRGVTGFGDTIVAAIVDDGLDTLHPDLKENVWRNYGEIPWNGKDDDSNGYVDDQFGWNGGDSNNRVITSVTLSQGHGTEVAGTFGACTANNEGIASIGYKCKIMPLLCYSSHGQDAEVGLVRSMLYILRQKRLYFKTKGKKGANVVVANFSVGFDNAFPKDAPIWCAFFDSLGSVGILSAGATTNANSDIDAVGDLPSTCPSPFTIIVSYTNKNDVKGSCGYSPTQIDIAAPGEEIFTTQQRRDAGSNAPYSTSGGTSLATGMITGAVTFVYNNVCDTFLRLQRQNNAVAMALLKYWIVNGVDTLASLKGKCASGGRLNLLKVWQLMDKWCKPIDQKYGLKDLINAAFQIFPNPIDRGENLRVKSALLLGYQFTIIDVFGRVIIKGGVPNNLEILTNIQLPAGLYFVAITNGKEQLVRKLQVL
jgi:hypothetical protein